MMFTVLRLASVHLRRSLGKHPTKQKECFAGLEFATEAALCGVVVLSRGSR
jgi:hypothetical protein